MLKQSLVGSLILLGALVVLTARGYFRNQDRLYEYSQDFPEILHLVDRAYVDDVNMNELMPGVFQGALEKLDENASYLPPGTQPGEPAQAAFLQTGLVLGKRNGYAYILAVAEGSAAEESGIVPNSYLRKINDRSTHGMSIYAIRKLLAGDQPSFKLSILIQGQTEDLEIELKPGSFPPVKLEFHTYADHLCLIRIPQFYDQWEKDLLKALQNTSSPRVKIVLDLRNNAMGTEKDLRALASVFLPEGKIASWVNAKKQQVDLLNPKRGSYFGRDLFLLVDRSTSHAAEIFGAISQEQGIATLVGFQSLGFSTHYQTIPLKSGGYVRISTQSLQLNSGAFLSKGLKPDLKLERESEAIDGEEILSRALEMVRGAKQKKAS